MLRDQNSCLKMVDGNKYRICQYVFWGSLQEGQGAISIELIE